MQTGRKLAFSDIWMRLEMESVIYNVRVCVCVMFSDKVPDWPAALTLNLEFKFHSKHSYSVSIGKSHNLICYHGYS